MNAGCIVTQKRAVFKDVLELEQGDLLREAESLQGAGVSLFEALPFSIQFPSCLPIFGVLVENTELEKPFWSQQCI